ncbi:MAG: zinc-ribbon domain-containing protein, partial [Prevotella sp.]|nr:zinc-ribbon domain-containing protein [Prevotella sp.]
MAKCLKCGNELQDGQKFCMKCGTPVSVNPQPAAPAVCSKCGNPLKPCQKFC